MTRTGAHECGSAGAPVLLKYLVARSGSAVVPDDALC